MLLRGRSAGGIRARLAGFAGFLRANGYGMGGGDAARVLETAARVGILDPRVLRWSLKALLCGRGDEWHRFDALFDAYFLPPNRRAFTEGETPAPARAPAALAGPSRRAPGSRKRGGGAAIGRGPPRREPRGIGAVHGFPRAAPRRHARDIEAAMRHFARRLKHLQLRREARAPRPPARPPRHLRRSVATGGTPLRLAWRVRRRVRPRLVWLLDVSRSMSAYSFFHLRLARALCAELADVHCFIFHTRITGVAAALARSGSVPLPGKARAARGRLGWGHADRRMPRRFQPRARARLCIRAAP